MLAEQQKRKDNFDESNSVGVVLADGQTWHLPKPWLEIRPVFHKGKAGAAYPAFSYSAALDALVGAVADADRFVDQVSAVATLAADLLLWHYDLTDVDLDQLLAYRRHDPASIEWTERVVAIATGHSGPKVLSAGGD